MPWMKNPKKIPKKTKLLKRRRAKPRQKLKGPKMGLNAEIALLKTEEAKVKPPLTRRSPRQTKVARRTIKRKEVKISDWL